MRTCILDSYINTGREKVKETKSKFLRNFIEFGLVVSDEKFSTSQPFCCCGCCCWSISMPCCILVKRL